MRKAVQLIIVNGRPRSTKALRAYSDHEPEHGRYTTYANYGCRCDPCTADNARYIADYRRRNPGYTRPKRKRAQTVTPPAYSSQDTTTA